MTDWRTGYTRRDTMRVVRSRHQVVIYQHELAIDIAAAMSKVPSAARLVELEHSDDDQKVRMLFEEEQEEGDPLS